MPGSSSRRSREATSGAAFQCPARSPGSGSLRVRPVGVLVIPQARAAFEPARHAFALRVELLLDPGRDLPGRARGAFAQAIVDEGSPRRAVRTDADVDEVLHAAAAAA